MCSLAGFQPPPSVGHVTQCEVYGELVSCDRNEGIANQQKNLNYPDVRLSSDMLRPNQMKVSDFLESSKDLKSDHGLSGVLYEFSSTKQNQDIPPWLFKFCKCLSTVLKSMQSVQYLLFPSKSLNETIPGQKFEMKDDCVVKAVSWHQHVLKFALALCDDSVRIYTKRHNEIIPTLKHRQQKGVMDLAWQPLSASGLAVACQYGVLVWTVDPSSLATRPSSSAAQVLKSCGHAPVTSVSWEPQGLLLASASPADASVMIWNVAAEIVFPLRRVGRWGIPDVSWSPDGRHLMATSQSAEFRIWDMTNLTVSRYTQLKGSVSTACWSSNGVHLLFATSEEPFIFGLTFDKQVQRETENNAVLLADVSKIELKTGEGQEMVGGLIKQICWDSSDERLAVSFQDSCNVIALFQTRTSSTLELLPYGFIRGENCAIPLYLSFQPKFEDGALLLVVWHTGAVSYIPMYFVSRGALNIGGSVNVNLHMNGQPVNDSLYSQLQ